VSYLLHYARRPDSIAARTPAARVDEHARLNRPGLYGDAFVRVLVEDTTAHRRRRDPQLVLQIADCTNTINLELSLETAQLRENSLFKAESCSARSTAFATASPLRPSSPLGVTTKSEKGGAPCRT
jgi:hypothetical protein